MAKRKNKQVEKVDFVEELNKGRRQSREELEAVLDKYPLNYILTVKDKETNLYTVIHNLCINVLNHPSQRAKESAWRFFFMSYHLDTISTRKLSDGVPEDETLRLFAEMTLEKIDEPDFKKDLKSKSLGRFRDWFPDEMQRMFDDIGRLSYKDAKLLMNAKPLLKQWESTYANSKDRLITIENNAGIDSSNKPIKTMLTWPQNERLEIGNRLKKALDSNPMMQEIYDLEKRAEKGDKKAIKKLTEFAQDEGFEDWQTMNQYALEETRKHILNSTLQEIESDPNTKLMFDLAVRMAKSDDPIHRAFVSDMTIPSLFIKARELSRELIESITLPDTASRKNEVIPPIYSDTMQEVKKLSLIPLTVSQIAIRLMISESTVKRYRKELGLQRRKKVNRT